MLVWAFSWTSGFSHIEKHAVLMQPIRDQDALTKEALDLEFHFLIK